MNRRDFLKLSAGGATLFSGCGGGTDATTVSTESTVTSTVMPGPAFEHFVERSGRHFTIDGKRFYTNGANNQYIYEWPKQWVRDFFQEAASMGLTSVRIECRIGYPWQGPSLLTGPYEYDEEAFKKLDYAVAEAGRNGIRVILVLSDYWSPGGIESYVAWSDSASSTHEFYADQQCQDMYRSFIRHLIERENSYTGVTYREAPTIMMWELMNEPQLRSNADGEALDTDLEAREETLQTWIEETSAFLKSHDENHLVSTGIEGYYNEQKPWMGENQWYTKLAQDFIENHRPATIDACSVHLYPESFVHQDRCVPEENCVDNIQTHIEDGHQQLDKPVYVGEFGYPVNRLADDGDRQLQRRNETLRRWYNALDRFDADGAHIWELFPEQKSIEGGDDGPYFLVFTDDAETRQIMTQYSQKTAEKSGT